MIDRRPSNTVAIIGAGGHVGLPLSLVLAEAKYNVIGIDTNAALIEQLKEGVVPYVEEGAQTLLRRALKRCNLNFTPDSDVIAKARTVIVIIGTPVDEYLNPRMDPLHNLFERNKHLFRKNQLILLRSTLSPGTTDLVRWMIEDMTGMKEGRDFFLCFAPERVMQTKGIKEIKDLPQLIGAFNDKSYARAKAFFDRFIRNVCLRLTPVEAEIGKLITNMARYISFAVSNEFYMIADSYGANIHRVIRACNLDYPRLNLPRPGPNVGGPCLYKDGYYLVEKIPYPEIIDASFKINEAAPMYLLEKVKKRVRLRKAGILGMTFKANCDDVRNSLSYKLRKQLRSLKCAIVEVDPYVPEFKDMNRLKGVDALFLMTPHREFGDLKAVLKRVANPNCLIVDMWNFWDENEHLSHDGLYHAKDVRRGR